MRKRLKQCISYFLVLGLVLGFMLGLAMLTFAADAGNYSVPYTATARVDESIGLRAFARITGNSSGNIANGITPMETRLIRSNAKADITNDSTLNIEVTPYERYALTKVVIAAIATITHGDGTEDAVKAVYEDMTPSFNYTVPDFTSYVTSGDKINVEVVAYADLTYAPTAPDVTINVSDGSITPATPGLTYSGNRFQIDTATLHGKTVKVTGVFTAVGTANRQIYVYNSSKNAGTRDINLTFDGVEMYTSGANAGNYKTEVTTTRPASSSGNVSPAGTVQRTSTNTHTTMAQLNLADVDAYVTFTGENIFATAYREMNGGSPNTSAIRVDASASLIVTDASTGSLYARGGGCSSAIGNSSIYPSGYVEIDGGTITATSAHNSHAYAGIGNGGHYDSADPGTRGIVINGGTVNALGFHFGIGANGGSLSNNLIATPSNLDANIGPQYVVITGGDVVSESSAGSAGASIGFSYNNEKHEVRIGRPDKGDGDSSVTSINWGYGAAISGKMTFYSGTTKAYSGQYAAAIGGNAVSYSSTDPATATQAQGTLMAVSGTPLTVYGGNVAAEAGAFEQQPYVNYSISQIRGNSGTRLKASDILNQTRPSNSYGAGIGGAVSKSGGMENHIFAGNFDVISSVSGAGIGGGGAYNSSQTGGAGGNTWIGTLTNLNGGTESMSFLVTANKDSENYGAGIGGGGSSTGAAGDGGNLYIGGGSFAIESGRYGAGIGGGGSYNSTAGSGGDVAIRGGEFTITSDRYGAGIGGGGSYNGTAGNGGDVAINVATDTGKIATPQNPNSSYLFEINSGQFGAGIGGGGSYGGTAGKGATKLTITGGNFGITAGGNDSSYDSISGYSYGAGIGGGGSYDGTAGNGPDIADLSGGYFDVYTRGYGSAIGGGGAYSGTAGGCGLVYVTGGTIRAESDTGGADLGTKGLGGGASANGTSHIGDGTVIIIGGNVYTSAGTTIANSNPGQHAWTRPNLGNLPSPANSYTDPNWDRLWLPTIPSAPQDMVLQNTTQQGQEVGSIDGSRIGQQVYAVQYSFPQRNNNGSITGTVNYSDYGIKDMYITPESGNIGYGAVSVWVPAGYMLTYNLNGGSGINGYSVDHSMEYAYGSIAILTDTGSSYPGNGQTKPLVQHDSAITGAAFDGLYSGKAYADGSLYRMLLTHTQTAASDGTMQDVVFAGWTAMPDSTIYEEGQGNIPNFLKEVTFQTADIEVYAVWGFDKNQNGVADILESGLELSYDGNEIMSSSVTGVPSESYGQWGQPVAISYMIPAHSRSNGEDVVFVGWSEMQLTDAVRVSNHTSAPYSGVLQAALYNFGGDRTFTAGGTTYTVHSNGGYIIKGNTTLYAVWAIDANSNGVPDYLETTYGVTYVNNASGIVNAAFVPPTMPSDSTRYVKGQSVVLDGGSALTGLKESGSDVVFLYWTANSAASSTIYGYGARTNGLLPVETVSTVTIADGDVTLYVVWSYDATGNGVPDVYEDGYKLIYRDGSSSGSGGIGSGSGTMQPYPFEEGPYYYGDSVTAFPTPDVPSGWHFEGWTDDSSKDGTYTNEAAWNTAFVSYPAPANTFKGVGNPVDFANGDITLYAVWSKDTNGNGTADWTESAAVASGPHYVRYIPGSNIVSAHGGLLDTASVPYASNIFPGPETVTKDDNNGAGYADGNAVSLDLGSRLADRNGKLVFLGWSPIYNLANGVYRSSSSDLQNYIKHLQLIFDIQEGTNNSAANNTSASHGYDVSSRSMAGGSGYTPEFIAGRAYYTRVGASPAFDANYAAGFSGYNWNLYNGEGLLSTVVQSPYYVDTDAYSAAQESSYDSAMGWLVYGVWAEDLNQNGIADMFETKFNLMYDGNGADSFVPYTKSNILPDETVVLEMGRVTGATGYMPMSRYDLNNSVPYIFLGWTADESYNNGTAVPGDGSVYGFGEAANLPKIVSAVTFGSMDITVHALWGEDSNRNSIPDIYEGAFNLIYDANGGNNAPVDSAVYTYNDTVSLDSGSGMSHSSGYLFLYWTDDSSSAPVYGYNDRGSLSTEVTDVTFVGDNITVYAVWGEDANGNGIPDVYEDPYSLTYDANGGINAPMDTASYLYGSTTDLDNGAGMTHPGSYVFVGWTRAEKTSYSSVYTAGQQLLLPPTETRVTFTSTNITVNAVWSTDLNNNGIPDVYETAYVLDYDLNGGTDPGNSFAAQTLVAGQVITLPVTAPTAPGGAAFSGWYYNGTAYAPGGSFTMPDANVTMAAQWSSSDTYTISYNANGGSGSYSDTGLVSGASYTVKTLSETGITRSNYTFNGWNTAEDGSGTGYAASSALTVSRNLTLYAQWTSSSGSSGGNSGGSSGGNSSGGRGGGGGVSGVSGDTKYTLSFESNGGRAVAAVTANRETVIDLNNFTTIKTGYTFEGWYSDSSLATHVTSVTLTEDMTVYAKWRVTERPDMFRDDHVAYVVGYDDGKVHPTANITRAEVASIFFRLFSEETRNGNLTKSNSFSDVSGGAWYNTAVSTLASMDIIKGHGNGTFDPNAPITRAEFAAIAARFESLQYTGVNQFSDTDGHWAQELISRAANKGWISGYEDGTFGPDQNVTRAEAMTFINRVLGRMPENTTDLLDGMISWKDNTDTSVWYYLAIQEATNSHRHEMKSDGVHEKWIQLIETPDWAALEN